MLKDQIKMIVGLGNPGNEYVNTRHNLGFMVVDHLISRSNPIESKNTASGLVVQTKVSGINFFLMKPASFINNSGPSIKSLMKKHNIFPEEIIIVLDDLNLEIGKLRLRLNGTSGGHNGLKSIISSLQTLDFPRLRIGIGPPTKGDTQIDHVLGTIPKHQKDLVLESIAKASDAIVCSLETGFDSAMDSYN